MKAATRTDRNQPGFMISTPSLFMSGGAEGCAASGSPVLLLDRSFGRPRPVQTRRGQFRSAGLKRPERPEFGEAEWSDGKKQEAAGGRHAQAARQRRNAHVRAVRYAAQPRRQAAEPGRARRRG